MSIANLMAHFGINASNKPNPVAPVPPLGVNPGMAPQGVTAQSTTMAPNGVVPGEGSAGYVPPQGPVDPLAQFKDLWAPVVTDPNNKGPAPLFNATPESMLEAARKQDFRPQVSEAQMAAINKGGPEAFSAMLEVMNNMTQQSYATGAHATTRLIEAALNKSNFAKVDEIGTHIKRNTVSESLRHDNPLFSDPAVAPLIKGLESQLLVKFPNATSQEITDMARTYFASVTDKFRAPAEEKKQKEKTKGEQDWSTFGV